MKTAQEVIKYLAISFAVLLVCGMVTGIVTAGFVVSRVFDGRGNEEATVEIDPTEEVEIPEIAEVIEQGLQELAVDTKVSTVVIERGEEFKVEANEDLVNVRRGDGVLYIEERDLHFFDRWSDYDRGLKITIPYDWDELGTLRLHNGAGRASIRGLTVRNLELDLGAGKTELQDMKVKMRAKISTGAGYFAMRNSVVEDLDLDIGVGKVDLAVKLSGENKIDAGVGKLDLRLIDGASKDYRIEVDKGLGAITIDGEKMSDDGVWGDSGAVLIDIDGGVGAIDIWMK